MDRVQNRLGRGRSTETFGRHRVFVLGLPSNNPNCHQETRERIKEKHAFYGLGAFWGPSCGKKNLQRSGPTGWQAETGAHRWHRRAQGEENRVGFRLSQYPKKCGIAGWTHSFQLAWNRKSKEKKVITKRGPHLVSFGDTSKQQGQDVFFIGAAENKLNDSGWCCLIPLACTIVAIQVQDLWVRTCCEAK